MTLASPSELGPVSCPDRPRVGPDGHILAANAPSDYIFRMMLFMELR